MKTSSPRITSVDIVRGLVMIIMALDHVRDLYFADSLNSDPLNLQTTTPALFLTRWITHLCAPVFVFLSGVSAYLSFSREKNYRQTQAFLIKRGLWLIFLEFTVITFGVWADVHFSVFLFQVIGAIGVGFILLGLLIRLNPWAIGIAALVFLLVLNAVALPPFFYDGALKSAPQPIVALISPQFMQAGQTSFLVAYPPLVWAAIMMMGFTAAPLLFTGNAHRQKRFFRIGLGMLALFLAARFINGYGDTAPWSVQSTPALTFLSFINVTKYPPTLMFQLLFLGIMFLLLAVFEKRENGLTRTLTVYGRVPLFYYLLHWYLIHAGLFLLLFIQGYGPSDFTFGFRFGRPQEGPSGLGLGGVYLVWAATVLILYPLCKKYGQYKFSRPEKKWLRYL